jgi:hypothetical protein
VWYFLVLAGMTVAPVFHHVLQRFHLEADDGKSVNRLT